MAIYTCIVRNRKIEYNNYSTEYLYILSYSYIGQLKAQLKHYPKCYEGRNAIIIEKESYFLNS